MTSRSRLAGLLAAAVLPLCLMGSLAAEAEQGHGAALPDRDAIAVRVREAGEAAKRLEAGRPATTDTQPAAGDGHWPTQRPPMPYEIVRSLQFLQDQVARGNDAAIRLQSSLLRRFGPALLGAPPETWSDRRNLRAAALFVLSGGPPAVLRGILARVEVDEADRTLLEGSLAYVENRMEEAQAILSTLDLHDEEPALAAQLSLALGQLKQDSDPHGALAHLAHARLLMPGSLIDEAALRMGVMIAEAAGESEEADRLARRYFERYAASVYAGNFRARFAAVYAERAAGTEEHTIALVDDLTASLDEADRLGIYLAVARRSLVRGNLALAGASAERALGIDGASSEDRHRALLYDVASTLTRRSFAEATATLNAIDPELLHPADRDLRDAAYSVLAEMRAPIASVENVAELDGNGAGEADRSAILARGERLLNQISNDLKSLDP